VTRASSRFEGEICGVGTEAGHRLVVGRWERSPFGTFADVMWESPSAERTLLAPDERVAEYVATTYRFDVVRVVPVVATRTPRELHVVAGALELRAVIGGRGPLGAVLRCVPARLARATWFATAVDPVARLVVPGVRTRGSAGGGRREWYGATDAHRVTSLSATADGQSLGGLADVWPPVRFGFGSAPRRPHVVAVTTTISGS